MISFKNIFIQKNILTIYVRGVLKSRKDLEQYLKMTLQACDVSLSSLLLLNEQKLDNQLDLLVNFDFADWLSESNLLERFIKIAVVSAPKDLDSNRDFANFLANRGVKFKVFLEENEAIAWLKKDRNT